MSSDPYDRPGGVPSASGEPPPLSPESAPTTDPAVTGDEFTPTPSGRSTGSGVTRTRAAAMWSALAGGFLVLIVLLIFIAQNTESAAFRFLGWHWSLPLGVAILGAAVCGGLLTVAVGTARMYQLRRAAKKNARTHK